MMDTLGHKQAAMTTSSSDRDVDIKDIPRQTYGPIGSGVV